MIAATCMAVFHLTQQDAPYPAIGKRKTGVLTGGSLDLVHGLLCPVPLPGNVCEFGG